MESFSLAILSVSLVHKEQLSMSGKERTLSMSKLLRDCVARISDCSRNDQCVEEP